MINPFYYLVNKLHIDLFSILFLLLVALPSYAQPIQKHVNTTIAKELFMAPELQVPGTVVSRNDARIAAEISGRVIFIAEIGAMIKKNDILARTDDRLLQLQLRSNTAAIKRLQANLDYQRQQLSRFTGLLEKNNLAQTQLDEATLQIAMLNQDLEQAMVARDLTQYRINHSKIRAPFSGRVVQRLVNQGEYASPGTPIARLTQTHQLEVRVMLPVNIKAFLTPDSILQVSNDNRKISTHLRTLVPVADEVARTFEARVVLPDADWVVGAAVKVAVPSAQPKGVVAVPRDALILRSNEIYVIKIKKDSIADRVSVKTGSAIGEFIEVIGEVQPGDTVVIRGGEQLNSGQTVLITKEKIMETG